MKSVLSEAVVKLMTALSARPSSSQHTLERPQPLAPYGQIQQMTVIFFLFYPEIAFDILCKFNAIVSLLKHQILFSGKKKKKNAKGHLLEFSPSMLNMILYDKIENKSN